MSRFVMYLENDSQDARLAETLRRAGMAVLRSATSGMDGQPDPAQLAFATTNECVLYTRNAKDFFALHREYQATSQSHAGIIVLTRQRYSVGEQARRLLRIWNALSAEEMVNRAESISSWGEPESP